MSEKTCKATRVNGGKCKARPLKGRTKCFTHDEKNAKQRAQARRKGGLRTRTPHSDRTLPEQVRTLDQAREILEYTLSEISQHENSIARARVLIALFDSFIKSIEIGELENRIAALEVQKNG